MKENPRLKPKLKSYTSLLCSSSHHHTNNLANMLNLQGKTKITGDNPKGIQCWNHEKMIPFNIESSN
jgi:hypothetical protein